MFVLVPRAAEDAAATALPLADFTDR